MSVVSTKPTNGIERKTTQFWCVGADKIVEEIGGGKFTVIDWHYLDTDKLRRLHAVLGHVLTDLAAGAIEPTPEF